MKMCSVVLLGFVLVADSALACRLGLVKGKRPFTQHVAKSWEARGFTVGWIVRVETGLRFHRYSDRDGDSGEFVPSFRIKTWKPGVLSKVRTPKGYFGLDLSFVKMSDSTLNEVARLKNLHTLRLDGRDITPNGLSNLKKISELRVLEMVVDGMMDRKTARIGQLDKLNDLILICDSLTGTEFEALGGLNNLGSMVIDANVFDGDMNSQGGLKKLQTLVIIAGKITERGTKGVSRLTSVKSLTLAGAELEDSGLTSVEGLKHLSRLKVLQRLNLYCNENFRDRDLKHLSQIESLKELVLQWTGITDDGLIEVAHMKSLRKLDVSNTAVSDNGKARLQRALPKLKFFKWRIEPGALPGA